MDIFYIKKCFRFPKKWNKAVVRLFFFHNFHTIHIPEKSSILKALRIKNLFLFQKECVILVLTTKLQAYLLRLLSHF